MTNICLYLHAHQPLRLRNFSIFDIGKNNVNYFDETRNKDYLQRVAGKSYLPANRMFLELIKKTYGKFRISFSISGVLLEQLEKHNPEIILSFQELAKTGFCDFLTETYYHSLSSFFSEEDFIKQVKLQGRKLKQLFGIRPEIFRNTELLYYNNLARIISDLGYKGILIEGADRILRNRSPNVLYCAKRVPELKLILKNYPLSDDIAFRFSTHAWREFPLTADKFLSWIKSTGAEKHSSINLFMDYETFGEHQWEETGIFEFFRDFVLKSCQDKDIGFLTVREIVARYQPQEELDIVEPLTWADTERDLSAWLGNDLQKSAAYELYGLEKKIVKNKDKNLISLWRHLQTSDHFYYMCTKWFNDGDVHKYFNPYDSPYDAYINYMNILKDLESRI